MKTILLTLLALALASTCFGNVIQKQAANVDLKVGVTQSWNTPSIENLHESIPTTQAQVKLGLPLFFDRLSIQGNVGRNIHIDGFRVASHDDYNFQAGVYFRLTR